jgi:hypothetical protein
MKIEFKKTSKTRYKVEVTGDDRIIIKGNFERSELRELVGKLDDII